MASSEKTISIGFKIEEGANGFKSLVMNAENLQKAMNATVSKADKLTKTLINFSSLSNTLDSVSSQLTALQGAVKGFTDAYQVQLEAETKLEQVMRNTMNAREEDIQSIKDYCSAQQEIGIVGDEVQLAGAQELATYLELKGSLKSLIPVMNDMVAQQYGYNNNAENAVTIATMLGKVMQGQTNALSRLGYKFDEAQEKVLKYGTETERAAMLAEVVGQSVGGMNEKLAQTDAGKMKQLENTLGDMKERLGALMQPASKILTIGANATVATVGVLKLYKGIQALATAVRSLSLAGGALMIGLTGLASVITYFVTRTNEATEATDNVKDAETRAKEAIEAEAEARRGALSAIELNIAKLKDFNGTKTEEKKLVTEMNNTYGETMGYFKTVAEWYDALTKNSKTYCEQMVAEARTRQLANRIAEIEQKKHDIRFDEKGNVRKYSKIGEKEKVYDPNSFTGTRETGNYVPGTSDLEKAQKAYEELDAGGEAIKKQMEGILKNVPKFTVTGSSDKPDLNSAEKTRLQEIEGELKKLTESYAKASGVQKEAIREKITALKDEKYNIELARLEAERPVKLDSASAFDSELAYWAKMRERATGDAIGEIDRMTDALREQKSLLGTDSGSQDYLKTRISSLASLISASGDEETRRKIAKEKALLEKELAAISIPLTLMADDSKIKALIKDIKLDDIKVNVKVDEKSLANMGKQLDLSPLQKNITRLKKMEQELGFVNTAGKAVSSTFSSLGSAFESQELNVAGIIAGAIANIAAGYAQATTQVASKNPFAWAAFALSGVAEMAAIISQIKSATAFASGGIVSGPTYALVGEYAGASNNPEVIAPLNKLKSLLGETGSTPVIIGGRIEADGRTLAVVLENQSRIGRKSGKRINI